MITVHYTEQTSALHTGHLQGPRRRLRYDFDENIRLHHI